MVARRFHSVLLILLAAAVLFLGGCGGNTAVVRGKVMYKGKPVPHGTITFIPESGPAATGEIQPDGSYTLGTNRKGDGAAPGKYTVIVVAMEDTSTRLPEDRNPTPPPIVPAKYTSQATSDLRADVKPGTNEFNFELKDK